MDWNSIMHETHVGSWALLILFFVLTYFFKKTFLHMILRLFYVLMLVSGVYILFVSGWDFPASFHLKALIAVVMVGAMEMLLVRRIKKGQSNKQLLPFWIAVIVLLAVLLLLAFRVITFG